MPDAARPPGGRSRLGAVPTFKPAYLIHGDDHGRLTERRARLRALAESEAGAGGVAVYRTDRDGSIRIEGDHGRMRVMPGRREP